MPKKTTKKEPESTVLQLRLPTELLGRVDKGADIVHRTRPDYIRLLLEKGLDAMDEANYKLPLDFTFVAVDPDA